MRALRLTLLCPLTLQCLFGCAALLTGPGTDPSDLLFPGSTQAQLTQRLGTPIRRAALPNPTKALALWEQDHKISLLVPRDVAVSESVFQFVGRLGSKEARAGQAGFDSFMTLGIAELYLIPKALWERAVDEHLELTVWFAVDGRALAYRWESPSKKDEPPK